MSLATTRLTGSMLTLSREDDTKWPQKNKDGRQELEIRLGSEHISFEVGSLPRSVFPCTDSIRLQRLARSRTYQTRPTQKAFASSTTSSRT